VLGVAALIFALVAVFGRDGLAGGAASSVAERAANGLVAVVALLAAEALLLTRRWVFPATAAMFLSFFAALVLLDAAVLHDLASNPLHLVWTGGCVVATLVYVYVQARRMSAAGRVSAAPRPPGQGMP
jgi:hypothetical protein